MQNKLQQKKVVYFRTAKQIEINFRLVILLNNQPTFKVGKNKKK